MGQRTSRRGALAVLPWLLIVALVVVGGSSAVDVHGAPNTMNPVRVLDTRTGLGGVSGKVGAAPVQLVLPAAALEATAVVLNITATGADGPGYVRAWPCAADQPSTSSLNYTLGRTVANAAIVRSGSGGVCVASLVPTHLVVDLSGWFSGSGDLAGTVPNRVLDTRQVGGPLAGGVERRIRIGGTAGIPADAALAVLNMTVTNPAGAGWLVAYPCGQPTSSSSMNFGDGETVANLTLAALSGGEVCVLSLVTADLVIDTFGWSAGTGAVRARSPARLLDTREPSVWPYGIAASDSELRVQAAGRGGLPADAAAALVTVTAVGAGGDGFVSVWPCDQDWPTVSTVNTWPGQAARANMAVVGLAADGTICLKTSTGNGTPMHVVVDVFGWVSGGPSRNVPPPTVPPSPPTVPPPPGGGRFGMLPVGAVLPSDVQCSAAVRPAPEVRAINALYNQTRGVPSDALTGRFARVTGDFVGTTDEIIQWASCKWGIDEDVVRAQTVIESWWRQTTLGDFGSDASACVPGHGIGVDGHPGVCPQSVGLMQLRYPYWQPGFPSAIFSSAFNLDFALAARRSCFEGDETWLNGFERGHDYAAGDIWGCVGRWMTGRWYTADSVIAIGRVRTALIERTWVTPPFLGG